MEGSPAQWNAEGRQRRLRWSTRDEVPDAHDMIRTDLAARFLRPQEANTRPRSRLQLPEARADHQIGDPRCLGRGRTSGNQRDQGYGAVTCRARRGLRRGAPASGGAGREAERMGEDARRMEMRGPGVKWASLGGVTLTRGVALHRGFRTGHVGPW